ncbi:unnamed protein product [Cylindrotheca closterium]|uniref:RecQ-mediated genome instability protein 1 n=1 Tax=Cylindrotheca closterium TaxID=2856 RepID=A0AAD2G4N7_9STRA|nr:unnamed protein product [Cylindrotheca closterium]
MSTPQEIQNRIQEAVGIQVSSEWLHTCIAHLQQQPGTGGSLVDRCVHQLLYSDIRDLVENNANSSQVMAHNTLQGLIARSKQQQQQQQQQTPIQTPNDFCMLVQLEEAIDFSLSRENRFNPMHFNARVQQNNHNNYNNRNALPRQRCLKLCLSSGMNNASQEVLVAQESSYISNLKPDSPSGMKIVLKGPIIIKHGYLQLHNGNCTVIGGQVQALVELQKAAMEKARKEMGVGIDPTVRALVGVGDLLPDEPEEGEGDDEEMATNATSPAPAAPPPPLQHHTIFTAPSVPTTTNNGPTTAATTTTMNGAQSTRTGRMISNGSTTSNRTNDSNNDYSSSNTSRGATHASAPAPVVPAPIVPQAPNNPYRNAGPFGIINTTAAPAATATTTTTTIPNPQQGQSNQSSSRNQNPYAKTTTTTPNPQQTQNPYAAARRRQGSVAVARVSISPTNVVSISNSSSNNNKSNNPYAKGNAASPFITAQAALLSTTTTTATTTTTPSSKTSMTITPASASRSATTSMIAPKRNPYAKPSSSNNSNHHHHHHHHQGHTTTTSVSRTVIPVSSTSGFQTASTMLSTIGGSSNAATAAPPSTSSLSPAASDNLLQNITFSNLYKLLEQAVQNRQLYETYAAITFRVSMFHKTGNLHFNIGKNRDYKKLKPANKYCFIMQATFGSTTNTDLLLACKFPSTLIEPYFELSPKELRDLAKVDRIKSDRIVKEGGDKVRAKFFPLQYYKARLFPTVDEVFGGGGISNFALDNVNAPILILEPDKT